MTEMDILRHAMKEFAGIDAEAFDLSLPYRETGNYKKDDFYNEYKNICKHLGVIISGVFRACQMEYL